MDSQATGKTVGWTITKVVRIEEGYSFTLTPGDSGYGLGGGRGVSEYATGLIASPYENAFPPDLVGEIITAPASLLTPGQVIDYAIRCAKEALPIPEWVLSLHPGLACALPYEANGSDWASEQAHGHRLLAAYLRSTAGTASVWSWARPGGRYDMLIPVSDGVFLVMRVGPGREDAWVNPTDIGWIGLQRIDQLALTMEALADEPSKSDGPLALPAVDGQLPSYYALGLTDVSAFVRQVMALFWRR